VVVQPTPKLILHTKSGVQDLSLSDSYCWTIGRNDDNNIVLKDPWISRNHAMLQCMATGEYYLIDAGSRNGTFLNGRRVSIPMLLRHGDDVMFGQTKLEFDHPSSLQLVDESADEVEIETYTATITLHDRKSISILVVDIRNYTGLTRQMPEQKLSELIGTWFREAGSIIQHYGSRVDKYIGDAVMAVWVHESDRTSEDIIQLFQALRDLQVMTSSLQERFPTIPFPLRIGAGINTGDAMVGNTGSGDRPDYTALGDTVNAAFRLETATKQIQQDVAIGAATYAQIQDKLVGYDDPFKLYQATLKGYEMPIPTYACSFDELRAVLLKLPTE
jgi:adenylate cyclase